MKKLQRLEESKRAYDERTMNPRKNSDDEEVVQPPIATKEISRSMQMKEDLRQGVQHMVKFTRLSKTDKLASAGQKTTTERTGATTSQKRASEGSQPSLSQRESELEKQIQKKINRIEKFAKMEEIEEGKR